MRIRSDRLKALMAGKEVRAEDLAEAVSRPGLDGARARRAVANWARGSDHPRCKAQDIRAMARALDVAVTDIARFTTVLRYHRGSTQKARLVADQIRGKSYDEAKQILDFSPKRASVNLSKALESAASDAEQLVNADIQELFIAECRVDEGPIIKRFQPKDRGRAHPIHKQTSHITIGLDLR